jgi:acyl-CoA synthetase (AMP-forming)/AMP-acid ligase II
VTEPAARHIVSGVPLAAPVPPLSLPALLCERARCHGDATALIDAGSGRRVSYAEFEHRIERAASAWVALGLRPGDRLVMFAPNAPEWPIAALAAMAAGGVVSGANPQYGADDLAHQMRDAGARFVVTTAACLLVVRDAAQRLAATDAVQIVLLDGHSAGTTDFEWLCGQDHGCALPSVAPDTLAALPYSSGTTGPAKGVMLTHRTLVSNVLQVDQVLCLGADDVALAFLPMFHIYGFTAVTMCALAAGATVVTVPRFEPESFLDAIERFRVTRLAVVPPVLQFLATHPLVDGRDLSSLTRISSGAAPLSADLEARVQRRLGCPVTQGYGMTESSGVVATTPFGRGRAGASGQLLPATQARVVDPIDGADVQPGCDGEIWFRGPQAFAGYLGQPKATADTITPDGWVRSGDIGHFDGDGYLFITDRLKELIKVKGFQVAPAELEALLLAHPGVVDAAVIGRADERAGEVPVAYVVARDAPLDAQALMAWVGERVVAYKRLADVVVCKTIPKSAAGKILRRVLRQQDALRQR